MPLSGNIPVPFFEAGVETIHTDRPVVAGPVYPSELARQEVIKATNLKGCYVCSRCYRGGLDTQRLCDRCRGVGRTARANREAGNPPQGGTSIEYHRSRTVADFLGHDQTHGSPKRTSVQGHQMRVIGNASTVRRPVPGAACKLQFLLPEEIPAFLTETSSSPTLPQLRSGPTHRTTKASPTTLMSTTTLPLPGIGAKRVFQGLSSFRNSLHLRISVKDTTIPTGHTDIEVQHPSQPKSITAEKEDTCKGPKNKKTAEGLDDGGNEGGCEGFHGSWSWRHFGVEGITGVKNRDARIWNFGGQPQDSLGQGGEEEEPAQELRRGNLGEKLPGFGMVPNWRREEEQPSRKDLVDREVDE
ncbi:hypothetical protein NEUTE1DRAFT_110500 [Neurospora tetrasperma FGSC 2508]|uniref:Uncharacterized protein n=1 Tax=Neurospora tetrasperma (strain FGSC 2508 / ATCC MYA-4615 / P0657) TaxID=510951 RepID=F8MLB4_NEUT8|nr:uncharacterized protein NEUTE1DRAFT_110500 [Neurospora tetrasperma FGSC 2508]EGO58387.1 hypothetical protein NEUTE1DRAFT_110500 [Neurospora tetrasperma FGSC 2508]